MKTICNYTLAGLATAFACFCWTCFFADACRSLPKEAGIAMGIGLFLSFELVVLAGILVSKMGRSKASDTQP